MNEEAQGLPQTTPDITVSLHKPCVQLMVGNWFPCRYRNYVFSVKYKIKKSLDAITVTGVTVQLQKPVFLQPLECQLGDQRLAQFSLHARLSQCIAGLRLTLQIAGITFSPVKQQHCIRGPTATCLPPPGAPDLSRRSWRWTLPTWDLWTGWSNCLGWWNLR